MAENIGGLQMSLYQKYLSELGDPHNLTHPSSLKRLDLKLRELIGKTDDLNISRCSHAYILKHELPDEENRCRQCGIKLTVGIARWNDYLVIRHPKCDRPICKECAEKRPDIFHIKFREAINKLKEINLVEKP